jgi:hypothetical protein
MGSLLTAFDDGQDSFLPIINQKTKQPQLFGVGRAKGYPKSADMKPPRGFNLFGGP